MRVVLCSGKTDTTLTTTDWLAEQQQDDSLTTHDDRSFILHYKERPDVQGLPPTVQWTHAVAAVSPRKTMEKSNVGCTREDHGRTPRYLKNGWEIPHTISLARSTWRWNFILQILWYLPEEIPKGRAGTVPLQQMPLIDQLFKRVAVDLVGPINPVLGSGKRYILSLVDYATRYPEAVALQ